MTTWDDGQQQDTTTAPVSPTSVNGISALWLRPISDSDAVYVRIAKELYAKVASGQIVAEGKMPSITALCRQHGCSRRTAGHAYQLLESDKLTERVPGLGYFVAPDVPVARLNQTARKGA